MLLIGVSILLLSAIFVYIIVDILSWYSNTKEAF